jgi:transposase
MELHTIGIDLGKTVFHLVGLDLRGEVVVRKKFSRTQLLRFTANVHVGLIGMEWPSTAGTETRSATDSGAVCKAVRENEQERLHRCRGDR